MKRAREATKELERKTEALASARGTPGGATEREKRRLNERRRNHDVLEEARGEEKENGQSTATRRAKKTKACAKEKEREKKKTNEDEKIWSLFPAMTPRIAIGERERERYRG